ncbi:MAG TPA: reverse transcriptase domain-containing protein [Spirochaetota bacterium]|nr:reverse transcriptase domain-containing protein [Spirochaetota bacterium]
MKRYGSLFDAIISTENLIDAAYRASRNKRHRPDIISFNRNLIDNIAAIRHELVSGQYQPGEYREFYIYDKKLRKISAAPFRDRVVHHAICNIIMPLFEKTFVDTSFANRAGKDTHRAVLLCQSYLKQNKYYVKFDIQKYFPSIDHLILKELIRKKIKCNKTLTLIDLIIDNSNEQDCPFFYFEGDDLFDPVKRKKGLPIGNLTSQYFANIYLTPLDHYILQKLKIRNYMRYVDDFVIFGDDKNQLNRYIHEIEIFCEQYRMKIHLNKACIRTTRDGISFLGYRTFPYYIRLKKETLIRAGRRYKKNFTMFQKKLMSSKAFNNSCQAWRGHVLIVTGGELLSERYFRVSNSLICPNNHRIP